MTVGSTAVPSVARTAAWMAAPKVVARVFAWAALRAAQMAEVKVRSSVVLRAARWVASTAGSMAAATAGLKAAMMVVLKASKLVVPKAALMADRMVGL